MIICDQDDQFCHVFVSSNISKNFCKTRNADRSNHLLQNPPNLPQPINHLSSLAMVTMVQLPQKPTVPKQVVHLVLERVHPSAMLQLQRLAVHRQFNPTSVYLHELYTALVYHTTHLHLDTNTSPINKPQLLPPNSDQHTTSSRLDLATIL